MKKKTRKVVLLIENSREFDRGLLRGIAKYAQSNGHWNLYMIPSSFIRCRASARKKEIRRLIRWGAEGVIAREIIPFEEVFELGLPTVFSAYNQKTVSGTANIVVDCVQVGRLAAEHLLDRSFRHFAFCDYGDYFWSQEEYEGFRTRLAEAGHSVNYYKWPDKVSKRLWDNEQPILVKWLNSLPKPVGIMACIDERSRDVNEACKIAGLYVPEEVAIVGVSNDEFICRLSDPPLSSVVIDCETAGYNAARLLDKMITNHAAGEQVIPALASHVVTRGSTNTTAIEDPTVAQAVNYIRVSADRPIQVNNVLEQAAVSRTVLYKKFQTTLGHSINEEIRRARIEKIISLLVNSDLTINQIAATMAMDPAHFSRYFSAVKGVSPEAFRKKHTRGSP